MMLAAAGLVAGTAAFAPSAASAEGLSDMLFGAFQKHPQNSTPGPNFLADAFGLNQQPSSRVAPSGTGPAFCVRSCDGRYFPLTTRGAASPVQMCQALCPASPTKVYFGSTIDGASSASGERYADSENAFAYRKSMRADCTCNGRNGTGLAPIDLTLDTSLRPGDVIATTNGLVVYSGTTTGAGQTVGFTPIASYPGLTAEVRARLGEMKVAPAAAEMIAGDAPSPQMGGDLGLSQTSVPGAVSAKAKRAAL